MINSCLLGTHLSQIKLVIMVSNAYVEDVEDEWQHVLCGDENTIPTASEPTRRAESEVGESIPMYTISPNLQQENMILIHRYIDEITSFLYA